MKKKVVNVALFCLVQLIVLSIFICSIVNYLGPRWIVADNYSLAQNKTDTQTEMFTVKYISIKKNYDIDDGQAKNNKDINYQYIMKLNKKISSGYIIENDYTHNMDVKILSSSSDDLCYIISGAENNAVWKVYITFANGINPDFHIDKTGGNGGEK